MKIWQKILFSFAAALLATVLLASGVLDRVDRWNQDLLFQNKGVTSKDIVIIGIDDAALDMLGPYNTWDRNIVAQALESLAADPENLPAVVAIDVLYAGNTFPQADDRLAAAAAALGNVVVADMAEFGDRINWEDGRATSIEGSVVLSFYEPYDALKAVTTQGHINAMTDVDGVMRHALLYVNTENGPVYSMAVEAARKYMEKQGQTLKLPETGSLGSYYIPYTGMPGDFSDGVSVAWLMAGQVPSGYWKDKIVLIGPYTTALQDAYFTPIAKGQHMFGVEIQANVIQCLLEGKYKTDVPKLPQLIAIFFICAAAMFLFLRMKMLHGGAVCAGLIAAGLAGCLLMYRLGYVIHPLWLPAAVLFLYVIALADHYVRAARERQALALEKERIGAELALATRIQASSLIKDFPAFPDRKEFDIFASMTPAKEVGGDLYDFFMIDDDHLGMVIGDVSGKGVPAALFMMVSIALIRHIAGKETSPAKALTTVNAEICAHNPEEMFVTVWLGVLEISTGKLKAANAGHEFPAIKKPDGSFELLKDKHGFVIGGMEGIRYREYELQLEPGSAVFVYTDGVPEAQNAAEEFFGTDRMVEALQKKESGSPEEILESVKGSVNAFVGDAPQFDDLTMLCLRYNGPQEKESGLPETVSGPQETQ